MTDDGKKTGRGDNLEYQDGGIVLHTRLDEIKRGVDKYQEEDRQYKKSQILLNLFLVIGTFIGSGISLYQAHIANINASAAQDNAAAAKAQAEATRQEVEEMRKSGTDTHDLAVQAKSQTRLSSKLAENAAQANQLAQKTFEVSQQASVTLGNKDGVVAEFRNSHDPQKNDGLVIYFQNSGRMPAKLKWGIDNWFLEHPTEQLSDPIKFAPMRRTRNKKTGAIADDSSTDGSIGGEAVREVGVGYLPAGFVDYLTTTNRPFKLNGTYEYCDELGRYACRNFSLEYQRLPFGTFRIIWDNECIDRSFLGNTQPGPDEEMLPICVPRNAPPFPKH